MAPLLQLLTHGVALPQPGIMLSVEYHFAFLPNKFFARLLERSQWSQLKLHSSEMVLTRNFSKHESSHFLATLADWAKEKRIVF